MELVAIFWKTRLGRLVLAKAAVELARQREETVKIWRESMARAVEFPSDTTLKTLRDIYCEPRELF